MQKDTRLGIRLTKAEKSLFDLACKTSGRTASEVILEAVNNFITETLEEDEHNVD